MILFSVSYRLVMVFSDICIIMVWYLVMVCVYRIVMVMVFSDMCIIVMVFSDMCIIQMVFSIPANIFFVYLWCSMIYLARCFC